VLYLTPDKSILPQSQSLYKYKSNTSNLITNLSCGSQAEICRQMDRQGPHMQTVYAYYTKCAQ